MSVVWIVIQFEGELVFIVVFLVVEQRLKGFVFDDDVLVDVFVEFLVFCVVLVLVYIVVDVIVVVFFLSFLQ